MSRGTGERKIDGRRIEGRQIREEHIAHTAQRAIPRRRKIRLDRKQSQLNRIRLINFIRPGENMMLLKRLSSLACD